MNKKNWKESYPVTVRLSPAVEKALRKLAKLHGGVDRALRVLLNLPTK